MFALGRMDPGPEDAELAAIEFLRTLPGPPGVALFVLSLLLPFPLDAGGAVMCSFC